jgi:predicted ferric reductase
MWLMTANQLLVPRAAPARPRGFGWADLVGPIAIGTVVMAVFLWLSGQGLASLTTWDSAMGSLGLLTGLVASDLFLLQVVMLARIPWVELAWGHDLLARRHRWLGFISFWLMIAHILFFVVQRLGRAGGWDGAVMWELFVHESWLFAATVGTILVIIVVVTSVRVARLRQRYESWHLLHLYSYLGVALTLPHQIFDGADFHATWAQIYWWGIYALGFGAIVAYRLVLPAWRSFYHRIRVTAVVQESPDVVSVQMKGHRLDRLRTKSGQFFIWRFLSGPGWTRGTPYTISAAPLANRLRVTAREVGDNTARTRNLRPGTRVLIEGPYGSMTARRRRHQRMALFAAGVGITPIRALLEDSAYAPGEAILVYRYANQQDAIFTAELAELANSRGLDIRWLPGSRQSDGSWQPISSPVRTDAEQLRQLIPDIASRDIFVCGPPAWTKAVIRAARANGAARDQIHTEDFGW